MSEVDASIGLLTGVAPVQPIPEAQPNYAAQKINSADIDDDFDDEDDDFDPDEEEDDDYDPDEDEDFDDDDFLDE